MPADDLRVRPPSSVWETFVKIAEVLSQAQAGKLPRATAIEVARQLAESGKQRTSEE